MHTSAAGAHQVGRALEAGSAAAHKHPSHWRASGSEWVHQCRHHLTWNMIGVEVYRACGEPGAYICMIWDSRYSSHLRHFALE